MKTDGGGAPSLPAKAWWQSKTILGIVTLLGVVIFQRVGLPVEHEDMGEILTPLVALIAAVIAVVGRVKARKEITMTMPGQKFNPHAEVRKTQAVRGRGGLRKGYALPALLAAIVWMLIAAVCIAFLDRLHASRDSEFEVRRFEEARDVSADVIRFDQAADERPFFVRLLDSIRFSVTPKVRQDETGKISAQIVRAEIKGGAEF